METTYKAKKRACDSCYKKKHRGLPCTYQRAAKTNERPDKRKAGKAALTKRLERIEEMISQARQTLQRSGQINTDHVLRDASASPSVEGISVAQVHANHFSGFNFGELSLHGGTIFSSESGRKWLEARTGQKAMLQAMYAAGPPWQNDHQANLVPLGSGSASLSFELKLPNRAYVEEYLRVFSKSTFRLVFPLIDPVLFHHTIDVAYKPCADLLPLLDQVNAKIGVFAFLSMIADLQHECEISPGLDGDVFAHQAQHMLPQVVQEISLTSLQTIMILCVRQLLLGQLQRGSILHSLACRILFMLGAHAQPSPHPPSDKLGKLDPEYRGKSHLRKLFWLCYIFDKELSLRTGQPPVISDDHCDLSLPPVSDEPKYADGDANIQDDIDGLILPGELRLTILKSRTSKVLYSAVSTKKSGAQLLRDIRELDDALEEWRLSIPLWIRPTLSVSREMIPSPDQKLSRRQSMNKMMMHFEYHHLMATIHQASSRGQSWTKRKLDEMAGISSSLILALEASRSTLYYLRAAVNDLAGQTFWMVVFYPMSAILTIFCHVLMNPLDPETENDIELLESAPGLIKRMQARQPTQPNMVHIKTVDEFVANLARLARCAFKKAQEEGDSGSSLTLSPMP